MITKTFCTEINGVDFEIYYTYIAEQPGKTNADPDSCYEPEPEEINIESIRANGAELFDFLSQKAIDEFGNLIAMHERSIK